MGLSCLGFPRTRGDRPSTSARTMPNVLVPPALAGIDPKEAGMCGFGTRFPRTRGDRPAVLNVRYRALPVPPHIAGIDRANSRAAGC